MSSENSSCRQGLSIQVLSKRENPTVHGEIFTVRCADIQQTYAAYLQPVCGGGIRSPGANHPRTLTNECGPDLFFEIWDFSDAQQELEPPNAHA